MSLEKLDEEYLTISGICMITGLSDRTIRNYISSGILKGEKRKGVWYFKAEEVDAFIRNPAVSPSLVAKRNGQVYDFIMNPSPKQERCCVILDFPGKDTSLLSEYFCYAISHGLYQNLTFSYDTTLSTPRVILQGETKDILELINGLYRSK